MKQEKRRERSRFRSCCLGIIGSALLLVLLLAGASVFLYNRPISTQSINDRVLRRLERISGLTVAFDSATLSLAEGQYLITNLRFIDPNRPEDTVLEVGEVHATIHPWELLTNPESTLSRVVLKNPSRLDLVYSQNSVEPGGKSKFLLEAVRKAQPPGQELSGRLPFEQLTIENVEIAFTESSGILPDDEPAVASLRMRGDMVIQNQDEDTLNLEFTGAAAQAGGDDQMMTSGTMASGVKASLSLEPNDVVGLRGSVQRLALHEIFRDSPKAWLRANDLSFDLKTSRSETVRSVAGVINTGAIDLNDPDNGIRLEDEQIRLTTKMSVDTSAGLAQLRQVDLNSSGAAFALRGEGAFGGESPSYELAVSGSRLDEEYRAILERFLPAGWNFESAPEKLGFNIELSKVEGAVQRLQGLVQLRGVKVKTPALPVALNNLFGDIQFSDTGVAIRDVTADYAGARVALDGSFEGDLWQARTGHLQLNWSAIVDVANMLKLHGNQLPGGRKIAAAGRVSGNGTWSQDVSLGDAAKSGTPKIEGGFEFQDVSLSDPLLPGPISGLSGNAVVDDDRLEVSNLSGTMRGNEMKVDGFVQGDLFFWRDPQVSATLTSRLDLAHLDDYLPESTREQATGYELTGLAETRMVVSGSVGDLGSNLTGVMRLENVGFLPRLTFMDGRISDVSGIVRWNGSVLDFEDLAGKVNGEDVVFGGTVAATRLDLRVRSGASLDAVQKTFPGLGKVLDMSGGLSTDLRFSAGTDAPAPLSSLNETIEQARSLLDRSVKEQSFSLNGELRLDGANIRHIAMPPARKEAGRNIPEGRVTGMTGTVLVKDDVLSVSADSPISCAFSDTENCRLSGSVQLRAGSMPAMQVNISTRGALLLDTWVTGWGKELDRPEKPPITGKVFDLDANIQAGQIMLRGQRGGRSRGKLSFKLVQDESPRVTHFHEIVVQGAVPGTGHVAGSGRINSFVWDPQRFPHWEASVDVQSMPLETMLGAIFVQPSNIRGMTTGRLQLNGVGNNARSIRGGGSAFMRNLEIGGTAVIQQLGQTTGRNFGGMLFETAQAATFEIGNGALSSRDLALQTNGLQLDMRGDYWFAGDQSRGIPAKTIDGNLRLRLFKSVFGSIPIIGAVADLADEVTNAFLLAFRVTGTADNPQVTPVALPVLQGGS